MNDLTGKYFVKNTENADYTDFATLFDGLRILKIDGFTAKGQAKNVYTASWEYDEEEDFAIVMQDDEDPVKIIRECTDLDITFIIKGSYATNTIDAQRQHLAFVDYMTNTDVWVKSAYQNNLEVHCVCMKDYKPTTEKYQRGTNSYVMGTISMHMLEEPAISYIVEYTLDGVTTTYRVHEGEDFVLPLVAESGKQIIPASVNVSMSESNITDDTYNYETNTIAIQNVNDTVTITAESAICPDGYTFVDYVWHYAKPVAQDVPIQTNYILNSNTEMDIDVNVKLYANNMMLFGSANYADNPGSYFWIKPTSDFSSYKFGSNAANSSSSTRIKDNIRQLVKTVKNKITYINNNNATTTLTVSGTSDWTGRALHIGGCQNSANTSYYANCMIYRWKIKEDNALINDFVPIKRLSDGLVGLYDLIGGVAYIRPKNKWCEPALSITRTLENCTQSLISGISNTLAPYGNTWSSKFTPSSGYSFDNFQILVNGIDKTSELATYNISDDTWTVTMIAHWEDEISISASAV